MAYISTTSLRPITVAETTVFLRQAAQIWSEDEHLAFVDFIARNPETGDLIPATGGVRTVRWARQGMGKRGGARVIYLYRDSGMPLYLLMVYTKTQREDLSPEAWRTVQELVSRLKQAHTAKRAR